jgi:hypothetical protein
VAGASGPTATVVRDFTDPYLELVRLLREASEIEHALLVQYLYGAYSLKPQYAGIRGFGFPNPHDLIGVAIQEMQHLEKVNRMLGALGAAPNLVRQDFPYEPDIYPFPLNLEPLSRETAAKYAYTEAPASALDRNDPANATPEGQAFLDQLDAVLGGVEPNHLGSLYETIIGVTAEVIAAAPPGVGDLSAWPARLEAIKGEGETAHFAFFRELFLGTHAGFGGRPGIWSLPFADPDYPALPLGMNPSAFEGHPNQITDDGQRRRIAWLSDLHYWLVLMLLDLGYRSGVPVVSARAKLHMTRALAPLGAQLATLGVGLPFDPLSMGYAPGGDVASTVRVLRALVAEAEQVAEEVRDALPADFGFEVTVQTRLALDGVVPITGGGGTGGGGNGGGTGGGTPAAASAAVANQFWFEYDDHFLFNTTPEVRAAYVAVQGPDSALGHFNATRVSGTFPVAFRTAVTPSRAGYQTLSREQLTMIDRHFAGDLDVLRTAFEHFGQGDLLDDRRPAGNKVHMMDSSGPANPPIGYHRWHAIIRAMTVLDIDPERWQAIDRLVALAWAVHAEAQPAQDTANPPLPEARLVALRAHWLTRTPDQLDDAFSVFPFPAPVG